MTRKKRDTARADTLDVECGRVLGPDRGECLLPAGHKEPWCQDARALQAREYVDECWDRINSVNVEELREILMLCWIFGCPVSESRPDFMSADTVRREAWWLVWTGGLPK
jgi:hypothetical protein